MIETIQDMYKLIEFWKSILAGLWIQGKRELCRMVAKEINLAIAPCFKQTIL